MNPTRNPPPRTQMGQLRTFMLHGRCDSASAVLIFFTLLFCPWALGTAQPWSVWTMNIAACLLGILLLAKKALRSAARAPLARWGSPAKTPRAARLLTAVIALFTFATLAYCLTDGFNARATHDATGKITYHDAIAWLPQSYDSTRTFDTFFSLLGYACFFWSLHDWLMGMTPEEARRARDGGEPEPTPRLPRRVRTLLVFLSVNGAVLAIEAICQRLSGTSKLLWFRTPPTNAASDFMFGPYNYRGNAAQYLNLIWPATLGLWWTLRREVRARFSGRDRARHWQSHLLLPCAAVMAAGALMSLSRSGAVAAFACMVGATAIFFFAARNRHPIIRFGIVLFFGATLALGLALGWEKLSLRFDDAARHVQQREETYAIARQIHHDYPVFGTGPGTFDPIFQFYRANEDVYWPAQLHNDWLETLVTFGWVGAGLIWAALLLVVTRWFAGGAVRCHWSLYACVLLAMAGCGLEARYDFAFQIYSITNLFLVHCALLMALSRTGAKD